MISTLDELALKEFSIGEVCKAAGLSRTTIIKLEKAGLLKPHSVDEKTGYRSYTLFEVANLLQYRLLRNMDISQEEILDYFTCREDLDLVIDKMKLRMNLLKRSIEELELRKKSDSKYSFSFVELPDVRCYCGTYTCFTPADTEKFTAKLIEEAIELGLTRFSYEPLFSMRYDTDSKEAYSPGEPFTTTVCIPIEIGDARSEDLPEDSLGRIEYIRGGRAFSLLHHGDYGPPNYFGDAYAKFWEEVRNRNLRVTGPVRGIGIVYPHVGLDIDPSDYVFRFAALVEE